METENEVAQCVVVLLEWFVWSVGTLTGFVCAYVFWRLGVRRVDSL